MDGAFDVAFRAVDEQLAETFVVDGYVQGSVVCFADTKGCFCIAEIYRH